MKAIIQLTSILIVFLMISGCIEIRQSPEPYERPDSERMQWKCNMTTNGICKACKHGYCWSCMGNECNICKESETPFCGQIHEPCVRPGKYNPYNLEQCSEERLRCLWPRDYKCLKE